MWASPFIIPVIAIVGGLSLGAFGVWVKHREKMAKFQSSHSNVDRELESLRERVAALETIVTDSKEQLKREIDRL